MEEGEPMSGHIKDGFIGEWRGRRRGRIAAYLSLRCTSVCLDALLFIHVLCLVCTVSVR